MHLIVFPQLIKSCPTQFPLERLTSGSRWLLQNSTHSIVFVYTSLSLRVALQEWWTAEQQSRCGRTRVLYRRHLVADGRYVLPLQIIAKPARLFFPTISTCFFQLNCSSIVTCTPRYFTSVGRAICSPLRFILTRFALLWFCFLVNTINCVFPTFIFKPSILQFQ